ncbi:MAG: response regulator [Chloroflexota bacterium]|nr:response regulator [Chloroflexota bacterium]
MPPKPILIVEDEPDGADLVRRLLKTIGGETQVTDNAESALGLLSATPDGYRAVITDLALPEMDGFELMQAIRADAALSHLPLIAITAFHTPELRVRALEGGFDGYFPKPLDPSAFAVSLVRVLNGG